MTKRIIFSFIFNMIGLGSLWIADAYISINYDEGFISDWALYKSLIFIGVTFVNMGMDQAIVRLKLHIGHVFIPFLIQTLILGALLTVGILIIGLEVQYFYLYFIFILFALCYLFYAFERSNLNYAFSQLGFHFWKIIFLGLILLGLFTNLHEPILISFVVAILFVLLRSRGYNIRNYDFSIYKLSILTGMHFFLSLSSLNIILYLDQVLLNNSGQTRTSEILFSHITFFISPAAIILGFTGFILAPYLRENPQKARLLFKKYFVSFVFFGLVTSTALYFISSELFLYFKEESAISWLGIILCCIYFLRYLTIVPSSYLGSFASNKLIKHVSIVYHLANIIFIFGYYILLRISNNDHLLSISLSILVAWIIRIIAGYYGLSSIFKDLRIKQLSN